jgi:hypothetical protein
MRAACGNGFQEEIILHHVRRVVLAAALGGLPLGGCTEKPDSRTLKPDLAYSASDRPRQLVVGTALRPKPVAARPAASRPVVRAAPEKSESKMARLDPSTLVGMAPPAIDRILGSPAGRRAEAMTIEWTYIGQSCSLDIFFYPDIATGDLRALKYNVAHIKGQTGGDQDCVSFPMTARRDESD